MESPKKFSILITTKNRLPDLKITLGKLAPLLDRDDVECFVIDDGSTDGTSDFVRENFPLVRLHRNPASKGYLFNRNKMLGETTALYAISLDDDAHFLSENPLETIESHFLQNPECGLVAFRIFWGKTAPEITTSPDVPQQVKSFVGCGHAWKMTAWREIPDYPEWFGFYGEENFASLELFRKQLEVHYLPQVLVQHRVDLGARKSDAADARRRFKNSLKADWNNYLLFYPLPKAFRKMAYSVAMQFKTKIFKGHPGLVFPLTGTIAGLLYHLPRIARNRNALTVSQYAAFMKLPEAKIFWKP